MRSATLFLSLVLLSATASSACAATDRDTELAFTISKGRAEYGTIVGVMHRVPKGLDAPLSSGIETVIDASDGVVTELGVAQFALSGAVVDDYFTRAKHARQLTEVLTPATYSAIQTILARSRPSQAEHILQIAHPWQLGNILLQSCGVELSPNMSEAAYALSANRTGKPLYHLELVTDQVNAFPDLASPIWEPYLQSVVKLVSSTDCKRSMSDLYLSLADAISRRDLALIEAQIEVGYGLVAARDLDDYAITARNAGMVQRIGADLAAHKHFVYVVGVQHLVGPRGLLNTLRRQGFQVLPR